MLGATQSGRRSHLRLLSLLRDAELIARGPRRGDRTGRGGPGPGAAPGAGRLGRRPGRRGARRVPGEGLSLRSGRTRSLSTRVRRGRDRLLPRAPGSAQGASPCRVRAHKPKPPSRVSPPWVQSKRRGVSPSWVQSKRRGVSPSWVQSKRRARGGCRLGGAEQAPWGGASVGAEQGGRADMRKGAPTGVGAPLGAFR